MIGMGSLLRVEEKRDRRAEALDDKSPEDMRSWSWRILSIVKILTSCD